MNSKMPEDTISEDFNPTNVPGVDEVLETIACLTRLTFRTGYLYRGEPKRFPRVSSKLYRHYEDIDSQHFNIETVQNELLDVAKGFTSETDNNEILAQLQHFGYSTNLVDFTTDLNVALFFACDSEPDEDGRIVFLKSGNPNVVKSQSPANRVVAQKSVFVRPPQGYIEPDHVSTIPSHLKQPILQYLDDCHGIRWATIYNDLHGFIRHSAAHESAYAELARGITLQENKEDQLAIRHFSEGLRLNPQSPWTYVRRGASYMSLKEYESALADFGSALELRQQDPKLYYLRGMAYQEIGRHDLAIHDFDSAVELDLEGVDAYMERGVAWKEKGEHIAAIRDFDKVLELNPDNPRAYELRGDAFSLTKDHDRAIRDFSKSIDLAPGRPAPFSLRGRSKIAKGDYEDAIQDFDAAIELDQEHGFAYAGRAMARFPQSSWDQAKSDLETALLKGADIKLLFRATFLPFRSRLHDFEEKYDVKLPNEIIEILGVDAQ